ncbi:hypothetical protein HaLaN_29176, partial [Haematococcus lacustris]
MAPLQRPWWVMRKGRELMTLCKGRGRPPYDTASTPSGPSGCSCCEGGTEERERISIIVVSSLAE